MSLDHSKMGKRNFVKWGDTGDYTAILSDKELDIDWRTKIARNFVLQSMSNSLSDRIAV